MTVKRLDLEKYPQVIAVRPLGGLRLHVEFTEGSSGVHDFSTQLADDAEPLAVQLRDPTLFADVAIRWGALVWPNGYEIEARDLYETMVMGGELGAAVLARWLHRGGRKLRSFLDN